MEGGPHDWTWLRMLVNQGNGLNSLFPCCFFTFLFTFPSLIHAGAWTRAPGEVYSKLAISHFRSDKIYDPKGTQKIPGPDFTDTTASLYTEFGLTPRWTGIVSLPYKFLSFKTAGTNQTESGLSDVWLYIKRSLMEHPLVISAQFGGKIPLGYGTQRVPPLGQGQVDLEARLLFGKSFHPKPFYANAEIGYRRRNGPFSDELPYLLEGGAWVSRTALVKLSLNGVENRLNDDAGDIATFRTRPPNIFDQEYTKLGGALIFFLARGFSLELFYENVMDGGNTAAGDNVGGGLSWQGRL